MKNKKEKLFLVKEDGTEIGRHYSSTYGWLRWDLIRKLDDPANYEIIDLIEKEVPEQFRLTQDEITHYF